MGSYSSSCIGWLPPILLVTYTCEQICLAVCSNEPASSSLCVYKGTLCTCQRIKLLIWNSTVVSNMSQPWTNNSHDTHSPCPCYIINSNLTTQKIKILLLWQWVPWQWSSGALCSFGAMCILLECCNFKVQFLWKWFLNRCLRSGKNRFSETQWPTY